MAKKLKMFVYCFREFDEKVYWDALAEKYGFEYSYTDVLPSFETADLAAGCDSIVTTVNILEPELLQKFKDLGVRYIQTRTIGYDHIDVNTAKALGLRVTHITYPAEVVADFAIMMILMGLRNMNHVLSAASINDFSLPGKMGKNLYTCTVGVIGTGAIGTAVIKHLSSFGCRILTCSHHPNEELSRYCEFTDLDTIYSQSDVITLHVPSNDKNYHMINKRAFDMMKDDVLLVNTARGTLVDTDALIEALSSGKLRGACLDVIEQEQGLCYFDHSDKVLDNPHLEKLKSFPNVIFTAHTAFYTDVTIQSMAENTVKAMYDLEEGRENPHIIM